VRILEIRKARAAPIKVAKVSFQIAEGVGIRVFFPSMLKEIKVDMKPYKFTVPFSQGVYWRGICWRSHLDSNASLC